jgi:hypothetical protein
MKNTKQICKRITLPAIVVAVATAAFTTIPNLGAADFSVADLTNHAIATTPRAIEKFPWLAWQGYPRTESISSAPSAISAIKKNHSLSTSPRMLERFPELARAAWPASVKSTKSGSGESQLARVMKNQALAHSPRMLEQFPELRGYTSQPTKESVEIAPIK